MRAILLAFTAVLLPPTIASRAPASVPVSPAHFEMVIAPSHDGYTATCAVGCKWTTLSFACGPDCRTLIDDAGVYATGPAPAGTPTFAFRFHRLAKGWELESVTGTGWLSLSWGCRLPFFPCSARVTETGVSGPAF